MNRGRFFLCSWIAALAALVASVGGGLASGPGCCCDGTCPLGEAMARMGLECSMSDAAACSLQRTPKAPGSGAHARDALQPGVLWAAASLYPPDSIDRAAGPAAPDSSSIPDRPEIPPPRSS